MSYALNGVPRWTISVMSPPPERRLDEVAFTATLRQQGNRELLSSITKPYRRPPVDPPMATVNLRSSVLETKEILRRAGIQPDKGGTRSVRPEQVRAKTAKASAKFNVQRRQ